MARSQDRDDTKTKPDGPAGQPAAPAAADAAEATAKASIPKKVRRLIRKLDRQLDAARSVEAKRLTQSAKAKQRVAKRERQATAAAADVQALLASIAERTHAVVDGAQTRKAPTRKAPTPSKASALGTRAATADDPAPGASRTKDPRA